MSHVTSSDDNGEERDPEEIEQSISTFIVAAAELSGPPVESLADEVATVMRQASERMRRLVVDVPNDKIIAVMLLVSQRARRLPAEDPEHWRLNAASTLLSPMIGPDAHTG